MQYISYYITTAGSRVHSKKILLQSMPSDLGIPVTAMHVRVNEALFLELLNCVALLTYLEKAMKDLCCISIKNMWFRRLQEGCETAIQEVHMYVMG